MASRSAERRARAAVDMSHFGSVVCNCEHDHKNKPKKTKVRPARTNTSGSRALSLWKEAERLYT